MFHARGAVRSTASWMFVLAAATVLVLAVAAARFSLIRPINADEAYNFQIAKSIATNFCYCTRYHPHRVFPIEESTNGIAQYVAGLFFAITSNPDAVKAATAAAAMLFLGAASLLLDPWLIFLTALLFLVWYGFVYVCVNFLGEPWAIAFCLFGIAALRRCDFSAAMRSLLTSRSFILAIACFAVAAESKLLATLVTVPVTWAVAYAGYPPAMRGARILRATFLTAVAGLGTAAGLLLLVGFSVLHSTRSLALSAVWHTYTGYVFDMLHQGRGQARPFDVSHVGAIITQFSSPIVVALFVLSAVVLLYVNRGYALLLAVTLAWWLHYGVNERHVVIAVYVMIILGGLEANAAIERICSSKRVERAKAVLAAAAGTAAIALIVGIAAHGTFYAPARLRPFPNRERVVLTSDGRYRYSSALVALLRSRRYILTSGWFQFPELTLRENMEFYDRMSAANAGMPRDQVLLFFDTGNADLWPTTTVRGNCGRVLHTEGPLVVCTAKPGVPLYFQPSG